MKKVRHNDGLSYWLFGVAKKNPWNRLIPRVFDNPHSGKIISLSYKLDVLYRFEACRKALIYNDLLFVS